MVLFVVYLVSKALWVQLDVAGDFRHGPVRYYGCFMLCCFTKQLVVDLWTAML